MKKRLFNKNTRIMKDYPILVSLDVHVRLIYLYAVDLATGEVLLDQNVMGGTRKILEMVN